MKHKLQAELDVICVAQDAAASVAQAKLDANPGVWYPCGFACVRIKPARGPLVKALQEYGLGRISSNGGYLIHNPSGNSTQWLDAKQAGARVFSALLAAFVLQQKSETYPKYEITLETALD